MGGQAGELFPSFCTPATGRCGRLDPRGLGAADMAHGINGGRAVPQAHSKIDLAVVVQETFVVRSSAAVMNGSFHSSIGTTGR